VRRVIVAVACLGALITCVSVALADSPADGTPFQQGSRINLIVDPVGFTCGAQVQFSRDGGVTWDAPAATDSCVSYTLYAKPPRCDASYPDTCIAPPPPDLDCVNVPFGQFRVVPPDSHGFDADHDGIGCEANTPWTPMQTVDWTGAIFWRACYAPVTPPGQPCTWSPTNHNFVIDPYPVAPPPPPPPPPPPAPRPTVKCMVPKVTGKSLAKAKRRLFASHCRTGKVGYRHSRVRRGLVYWQSRRPGARLARGTRIGLLVSLGRR
jgi:PASTA domain